MLCADKTITPTRGITGDRFIPNRNTTQFEVGHYLVTNKSNSSSDEPISPSKEQFQKAMNENLNGPAVESKIIGYQQRPPELPGGRLRDCFICLFSNALISQVIIDSFVYYFEKRWCK